jgi:hypothetical protein
MYKCCLVSIRKIAPQLPCEDNIFFNNKLFFRIIFIKNNITILNGLIVRSEQQ